MDKNYVKDLESFVNKMLSPMRDLPFSMVIKMLSGHDVLPFNNDESLIQLLKKTFNEALRKINKKGIKSNRVNEVGNKIEPFVKSALCVNHLRANTPLCLNGRRTLTGYPDVMFEYQRQPFYIECKTYNLKNISTTQRSFYFSPSVKSKITKSAPHLMVSFEINRRKGRYFANHWKLYSLENLTVDLKHEFNQSNKKMYGDKSQLDLIAEG